MPAKRKKTVRNVSPAVPEVNPDAPLAVQASQETPPDVNLDAPIAAETIPEPAEPDRERVDRVVFLAGSGVTVAVVVGVIAIVALSVSWGNRATPQRANTPALVPTIAPTPSPSPFSRKDVTFEVLNGSGIAGAAGKAARTLSDLGYTVVAIGNSAESVAHTELRVSSAVAAQTTVIMQDISGAFSEATLAGTLADSTAAAQLVIGKK